MGIQWKRLNRKVHYWGAMVCALPVLIVIITGIFLLLKKEFSWIQPATMVGAAEVPTLGFGEILERSKDVPEAEISSWEDIKLVDVRPSKGILKVRAENGWEVQLDHTTGEVLQTAYRRSDLIESLHDGTFFHDAAKLWVFLPSAIVLLVLWVTGIYLFCLPLLAKRNRRKKEALKTQL
ncbi:PepSY domain-containing protein [Luteolibacter sp. AS25]|uniref:PepSY domain-containing protein n=1 Tax=Luteolibacter sp. AS25 TaxID=3135776 RepID=UPI00398AC378